MSLERMTHRQQAMVMAAAMRLILTTRDETRTVSEITAFAINELYSFGCAFAGDLSTMMVGTDPDEYLSE